MYLVSLPFLIFNVFRCELLKLKHKCIDRVTSCHIGVHPLYEKIHEMKPIKTCGLWQVYIIETYLKCMVWRAYTPCTPYKGAKKIQAKIKPIYTCLFFSILNWQNPIVIFLVLKTYVIIMCYVWKLRNK